MNKESYLEWWKVRKRNVKSTQAIQRYLQLLQINETFERFCSLIKKNKEQYINDIMLETWRTQNSPKFDKRYSSMLIKMASF